VEALIFTIIAFLAAGIIFRLLMPSCVMPASLGGRDGEEKDWRKNKNWRHSFHRRLDAKEQTNDVNRTTMKELVLDF
jgi:hypothetical protein